MNELDEKKKPMLISDEFCDEWELKVPFTRSTLPPHIKLRMAGSFHRRMKIVQ